LKRKRLQQRNSGFINPITGAIAKKLTAKWEVGITSQLAAVVSGWLGDTNTKEKEEY
jgi:hypothetical protein